MSGYTTDELIDIAETRELCGDAPCRDQTPYVCPCAAIEERLREYKRILEE